MIITLIQTNEVQDFIDVGRQGRDYGVIFLLELIDILGGF
jgi:hypothetical protein